MSTETPHEPLPKIDYKAPSRGLRKLGVWLTVGWIVLALTLLFLRLAELPNLTLNAWGDFLAGMTAPLALLWLVLGYLQQGIELQQNTDTLRLQLAELSQQVRETARLARHAERQATAAELQAMASQELSARERAARQAELQPIPRIQAISPSSNTNTVRMVNAGNAVENVRFRDVVGFFPNNYKRSFWAKDEMIKIACRGGPITTFDFELEYRDSDGHSWRQKLRFLTNSQIERLLTEPIDSVTD